MRDFVIAVSRNTETAWVSSRMDWQGVSRGEPFTIEGLRMTIVLEKQEGNWVIVHLHGSIPVSGQAIE